MPAGNIFHYSVYDTAVPADVAYAYLLAVLSVDKDVQVTAPQPFVSAENSIVLLPKSSPESKYF